jgi:hypothetical protein
MNKNWKIMK